MKIPTQKGEHENRELYTQSIIWLYTLLYTST